MTLKFLCNSLNFVFYNKKCKDVPFYYTYIELFLLFATIGINLSI